MHNQPRLLRGLLPAALLLGGLGTAPQRARAQNATTTAWDDYRPIMWQNYPAEKWADLQAAGVVGDHLGRVKPTRGDTRAAAGFRYYVSTALEEVYAPYHRWFPDRPKTFYFKEARKAFLADRLDRSVLVREPSLSDPKTFETIRRMATASVRRHMPNRPMFYSLADEPGIGNQAAAFDFGWHPAALKAFRTWLQTRYADLAALNRQWGRRYKSWDDVLPETTDEALARTDGNYSAWCDHKDFMDTALCDAYAKGAAAVKAVDPTALAGILGGQGPCAVGGWDHWKILNAVDVYEPYSIGNNWELCRSFAPDLPRLMTVFGGDKPRNIHHLWFRFLHGDRGCVIWDQKRVFLKSGAKLSAFFLELRAGLAKQLYAARRVADPIAVYYSQPSWRVHWILGIKAAGGDWVKRDSWNERRGNHMLKTLEAWLRLLEDNGLQYKLVSDAQLREYGLPRYDAKTGKGFKLLILPQTLALGDDEAKAIKAFCPLERRGTYVMTDGLCGLFDEHGKRRETGALDGFFGVKRVDGPITPPGADDRFKGLKLLDASLRRAKRSDPEPGEREWDSARAGEVKDAPVFVNKHVYPNWTYMLNLALTEYAHLRTKPADAAVYQQAVGHLLKQMLGDARTSPRVTDAKGNTLIGVEAFRWDLGTTGGQVLAVHRNPTLRVHELGQQQYKSNEAFETPVELTVARADAAKVHWFDTRTGRRLGSDADKVRITLKPFEPTILTALPFAPAPPRMTAPRNATPGKPMAIQIRRDPKWKDAPLVFHVIVRDAANKPHPMHGTTIVTKNEVSHVQIPLPADAAPGTWTVRVKEVLTGRSVTAKAEVSRER